MLKSLDISWSHFVLHCWYYFDSKLFVSASPGHVESIQLFVFRTPGNSTLTFAIDDWPLRLLLSALLQPVSVFPCSLTILFMQYSVPLLVASQLILKFTVLIWASPMPIQQHQVLKHIKSLFIPIFLHTSSVFFRILSLWLQIELVHFSTNVI